MIEATTPFKFLAKINWTAQLCFSFLSRICCVRSTSGVSCQVFFSFCLGMLNRCRALALQNLFVLLGVLFQVG